MTLKSGVYNVVKWVALIFLPAAGVLYASLAAIWNLKYATQVTNSVLAVDTFLGVLIGISSRGYTPPVDGKLLVSQTNETAVARMEFSTHPEDIIARKQGYMTLAIVPDTGHVSASVPLEMAGPESNGKSYD